nr:hypothetical protein [Tanacetum cinerariifolium]
LKDNPVPSSDFLTKSSSTSLNFLLEDTNTFDNSLPEFKTFCFDLEEISSGNTTTHSDISLPDYEVFYDDHVKDISSSSTTTHSDFSLYDSFIFNLSINLFPPTDRSDFYHEGFADELALIISPPEYDCFSLKNEPKSRDFTMDVVEDIFPTREPSVHVHNVLPTHTTLQLNLDFILSIESLFAYVFPSTDRSDFTHEEFTDELAHIISPPEYDCFYFRNSPDLGEWISSLNSEIRKTLSSTTRVNLPVEDDHSFFGVKDIKEKDKIKAKTGQNQEQIESVEKSKVKPDKVKAKSKPKTHQVKENTTLRTKNAKT